MRFREPSSIDIFLTKTLLGTIGRIYFKGYVNGLGFKKTDKVIDYGSGTGIPAGYIARAAEHVTCIDRSIKWLAIAKNTLSGCFNVDFMQGKIETLDIPDGAYDAIFIHFVIHDIDAHERKSIVETLVKKLKRGGRLYLGEPAAPNHGISLEDMNRLMTDCGLRTITTSKGTMLFVFGKVNYGVYEN